MDTHTHTLTHKWTYTQIDTHTDTHTHTEWSSAHSQGSRWHPGRIYEEASGILLFLRLCRCCEHNLPQLLPADYTAASQASPPLPFKTQTKWTQWAHSVFWHTPPPRFKIDLHIFAQKWSLQHAIYLCLSEKESCGSRRLWAPCVRTRYGRAHCWDG